MLLRLGGARRRLRVALLAAPLVVLLLRVGAAAVVVLLRAAVGVVVLLLRGSGSSVRAGGALDGRARPGARGLAVAVRV
jgi:hypothetical protein